MQDPKRRQVRAVPTHAGELANLGEAEERGYHRFTAAVLILPIAVETIAAGAGFAIDQRCRQIAIGAPGDSQTGRGQQP